MAASVVFLRESTKRPAEVDAYTATDDPSLAGPSATIHAAYGREKVLEGPEKRGNDVTLASGPLPGRTVAARLPQAG